jgi:hypothetical protein
MNRRTFTLASGAVIIIALAAVRWLLQTTLSHAHNFISHNPDSLPEMRFTHTAFGLPYSAGSARAWSC